MSANEVTARYDRSAAVYRELWAPVLLPPAQRLLRNLRDVEPRCVVDVGTGVGMLLPELRGAFPGVRVVGVDRSRGMLGLAPQGERRAVMDATQLAIADASADLVFMAFMLHHVANPQEAVREAARVTRPGGRVATITWAEEFRSPALDVWARCLDEAGAAPAEADVVSRHESLDSPEKVEAVFRAAGCPRLRSWAEDTTRVMDLEYVLRQRTSMGAWKPRFDSLDLEARQTCLQSARHRMSVLASEDFIACARVVFAIAIT